VTGEAWLTGPVPDIPPLLQPVAHALIQARNEVHELIRNFCDDLLWEQPAGAASAGFHLQHLSGILDRLFTYARGEALGEAQLETLGSEGTPPTTDATALALYLAFERQVEAALEQLRNTPDAVLMEERKVGRASLPSTVQGLLFHAADHAQRHVGQLIVTVKIVRNR
jgi:uncharacterized damage-inducible protein DinB